MIPFNKPFMTGKELDYIQQAVASGKISGDGVFSKRCQAYFEQRFGFAKTLLTTSCTDALEMAAILCDIAAGDEVIVPSYTFVSTANAFVLRGAKICFADSGSDHPNMDPLQVESLISKRTKVIVPVHYAGTACEMGRITELAKHAEVHVVEDAAQAIDSYYLGKPLGTFGALSAFSFHETKNVIAGEGGLLAINDSSLVRRAEIIREKGTNRSAFFRGEVDKYGWVDVGSSFLPSEITSAFLLAQLESLDRIQMQRRLLWDTYYDRLRPLEQKGILRLPLIPSYATNNAHMFYVVCDSLEVRTNLIQYLKEQGIMSVFHYQPLHRSPFYADRHDGRPLPNADRYADTLLRLPMYHDLKSEEVDYICERLATFFTR
ncbi:MAG: dTDP-4-amino-4,6-dideoxygalactose transaminase [candidate division Zixibacteria bacterium RBG_16_53_22]|nr:MAG: dTDP-4-amino-4,6-dideoxygalactose transaminase [candidate division Zixibacteria bacterium RBG_16_53_22]